MFTKTTAAVKSSSLIIMFNPHNVKRKAASFEAAFLCAYKKEKPKTQLL